MWTLIWQCIIKKKKNIFWSSLDRFWLNACVHRSRGMLHAKKIYATHAAQKLPSKFKSYLNVVWGWQWCYTMLSHHRSTGIYALVCWPFAVAAQCQCQAAIYRPKLGIHSLSLYRQPYNNQQNCGTNTCICYTLRFRFGATAKNCCVFSCTLARLHALVLSLHTNISLFFFFFGSYFIIIIRMECSKTEHWNMMNNVCFYYNAVALTISCVSFVVSLKPELRWIFIYICMHLFVWIELGSASVPSTNMIWMSFSYFVSLYLIFFLLGLCVYFPMILSYWKRENFVLTHTHTQDITIEQNIRWGPVAWCVGS